jgi:hypothetical protein
MLRSTLQPKMGLKLLAFAFQLSEMLRNNNGLLPDPNSLFHSRDSHFTSVKHVKMSPSISLIGARVGA